MAVAGTMCTPFSPIGKQDGVANVATEAWHLWSMDMEQSQHDIVLLENSHLFPGELWRNRIGKTHTLVSARFGPEGL